MQEMNAADEARMKREVLKSASVVCTTLNHSGANLLLEVLKPFSNGGRMIIPFGCIIVDEVQKYKSIATFHKVLVMLHGEAVLLYCC